MTQSAGRGYWLPPLGSLFIPQREACCHNSLSQKLRVNRPYHLHSHDYPEIFLGENNVIILGEGLLDYDLLAVLEIEAILSWAWGRRRQRWRSMLFTIVIVVAKVQIKSELCKCFFLFFFTKRNFFEQERGACFVGAVTQRRRDAESFA